MDNSFDPSEVEILGIGSYGKVISWSGKACKIFNNPESFLHEAAIYLYLTGLPGLVATESIDENKKVIMMDKYKKSLYYWMRNETLNNDFNRRCKILLGILQGLNSIHQLGLMHGDIKPNNILVNETGQSVLTDFGNTGSPLDVSLEMMTQFYAPPEKFATPSADIYALGIIVLEIWDLNILTSLRPYRSSYRYKISNEILQDKIKSSANLPTLLKEIALRCIDIDPEERPTASEFYNIISLMKINFEVRPIQYHLRTFETKPVINEIDIKIFYQTLNVLRIYCIVLKLRSPERTEALLEYWIRTRSINSEDYGFHALTIIYLYDLISNKNNKSSPTLDEYFGNGETSGSDQMTDKKELIYQYVCQILHEPRALQILIRGY